MEAARGPGPRLCCKPGGRLDMSHGFVHHIRRNQIARDDYDKKVKQAAKEKVRRRHTPAPTRPRKPDLQVYLPRHRGKPDPEESSDSSSSGGSEPEPAGHQLFCLEYEADSGEVTSVIVYQGYSPHRLQDQSLQVRRFFNRSCGLAHGISLESCDCSVWRFFLCASHNWIACYTVFV
ncbi:UPF0561 protein C2orf68 homolog isoform X2 [Ochotona princeps]|uniref:UPF0561 protein C2orf68 homolog isoform X2 n=1 Tax=Ochotona princeps TaxID=9978 RepID=UPI002714E143|nr:UPF0561 protein C2orf68 homolog isoform X2 [Ochotona princeps]